MATWNNEDMVSCNKVYILLGKCKIRTALQYPMSHCSTNLASKAKSVDICRPSGSSSHVRTVRTEQV